MDYMITGYHLYYEGIGNKTLCRPIRSVIILVKNQIGLPLRGITQMITNRIGLHSVLLSLLIRSLIIIHEIFSLVREWSKHVK